MTPFVWWMMPQEGGLRLLNIMLLSRDQYPQRRPLLLRYAARSLLFSLVGIFSVGCAETQSTLDPRGTRADQINDLWWIMAILGTLVFVGVLVSMTVAIRRGDDDSEPEPDERGRSHPRDVKFVLAGGIVMPSVILVLLFILTLRTLSALSAPEEQAPLTIEVTGNQWWWEARYPDQGVTTANEIHIPAGEHVQLRLESADVIHSFWVPQIQGKLDMIPGQTTTMWIDSNETGTFRGQCAEFCGVQHANMALHLVADPPDQFATWIDQQSGTAVEPVDEAARRGQELFSSMGCAECHSIRGTEADGTLGPDLTHVASREWLAAGTLRNTHENLRRWVANPQEVKPGNRMPAIPLDAQDLDDLVAYLESLE